MTPLWIDNLDILYEKNFIVEIVPLANFDFNRKLNSLLRLSIYYSLIVYILKRNRNIFLIPLGTAIFTYILGKHLYKNKVNSQIINFQNNDINVGPIEDLDKECKIPTKDNPFMNPILMGDDNHKKPCTSYNNKGIQKNIEEKFNTNLYREANDIFNKNNSQRQFYTVSTKTVPNDQESYRNWLYSTPPTCKEGNGIQCSANQVGVRAGPGIN